MKILLFFFIVLVFSVSAFSKNLEKVAEIETTKLANGSVELKLVGFKTKSKKNIADFKALAFYDLLKPFIKSDNPGDYLVEIIDDSDLTYKFSLAEFMPGASALPAILLISKPDLVYGDTIKISDATTQDKALNKLDRIAVGSQKLVVQLQIENLTEADKKAFMQTNSLIIPADTSTKRWRKGVKKIILYKIQN